MTACWKILTTLCRTIALQESRVRLALTALYAVNVAISYLLMLAIMTYNVGYFIAIVLGLAVGYFIFFNSSSATASTDVCCAQQVSVCCQGCHHPQAQQLAQERMLRVY